MTALGRKLRRDLVHAGGLLVAIALIMSVGICCYVAMSSAHRNLSEALQRYYVQCRMADFSIELKKLPTTDLVVLDQVRGITELRPRIQSNVTIDLADVEQPINGVVLSMPEVRRPVINDIVIIRGSYFTDVRDEEVIVNDAFARKHHLHPGGRIHVILNNRRQELFITGTAISSEFAYLVGPAGLIPDPEHFGVLYLKHRYMEDAYDFQGACNQLVGLLGPEVRAHPDPVLDTAERLLADYGVFTKIPRREQSSHRFLSNEIEQLGVFAWFMPAIFLSVAALVLNMLLMRLIDQQRTVIGTLKALGYSDLEVLSHYVQFGLWVGFIGGLVGCLAGVGFAELLTMEYRKFFEFPELINRFHPDLCLTGLGISLACSVAGAVHSAWLVLQLEAAEAMRQKPPLAGRSVWIERIGWLWNRLDSSWRMALRNLFRQRFRTSVGIFAAAMGAALVVNALLANQSLKYLIDFQFQKLLKSDVDLSFKDEQNYSALLEVRKLPGVDFAEPTLNVGCTFTHGHCTKRSGITGLVSGATLTIPRDTDGNALRVPTRGLLMGRTLADMLQVKAGDHVTIEPIKGLRQRRTVPVVAVSDGYLGLACYADLEYLSRLIGEEYCLSGAQLMVNPDPAVRRQFYREIKRLPALSGYSARADVVENLTTTLIQTNTIAVGVLLGFSGIIFFGSTLNSALISLAERSREVATLLVLGYTPETVGRLFLIESMLISLTGTLIGLPLGYGLIHLVAADFANELARLPIVAPPFVWFLTLGISVIFTLFSHAVVQWRIYRFDWQANLKVQE